MKPTEQLKEEHNAIKLMLKILDKVCDELESGKKIDPRHMDQVIDFIRTFADKCHHAKEEDLLFPAMEEAGIPKNEGPIAVMLMDHDAGRGYVKNMLGASLKYKKGDKNAVKIFVENARAYIELLSQHIDKEDNILYNIADMHLSQKQQKQLEKEFEGVEREGIGKGKHEEFHKILHGLEKIYL